MRLASKSVRYVERVDEFYNSRIYVITPVIIRITIA